MMLAPDDRLVDFSEFISRLNLSARTGRSLIARQLIGVVRIGRVLRIPESEIVRFISENYQPPRQGSIATHHLVDRRAPGGDTDIDAAIDRAVGRQKGGV